MRKTLLFFQNEIRWFCLMDRFYFLPSLLWSKCISLINSHLFFLYSIHIRTLGSWWVAGHYYVHRLPPKNGDFRGRNFLTGHESLPPKFAKNLSKSRKNTQIRILKIGITVTLYFDQRRLQNFIPAKCWTCESISLTNWSVLYTAFFSGAESLNFPPRARLLQFSTALAWTAFFLPRHWRAVLMGCGVYFCGLFCTVWS